MEKVYVCVANGNKKETGEPYSVFNALIVSKNYEGYNSKDSIIEKQRYPLGEKKVLKG